MIVLFFSVYSGVDELSWHQNKAFKGQCVSFDENKKKVKNNWEQIVRARGSAGTIFIVFTEVQRRMLDKGAFFMQWNKFLVQANPSGPFLVVERIF